MFKFNRLVVIVLLVGVAAVAWGAVKIPSFVIAESHMTCQGVSRLIELDADADGMAILNYVVGQNKTVVQVILNDFTGDTILNGRYYVRMSSNNGLDIGTFLVDSQGNGHFHGEVSGDQTGSNVELWAQPGPCSKIFVARGE